MSKELIRQLKSLKHASVKPDELWLQKNRELLLSQIKNTISQERAITRRFNIENFWQGLSIFLPRSVVYTVLKPATVMLLVFAMGVGSWVATVSASYESLPGEWLYPAKRVAEKTQVAVADVVGNKDDVVKLHGELAKKRAIEISKIVSQGKPEKIGEAAKTVNDLKDEIKIVSIKLEEIKSNPDSSSEAAKNINQSAKEIKGMLEGVKDNLLVVTDGKSTDDLSSQVAEAKNLVKDTAVKAVEIMVEKHLQGDASISKEEVKQAISAQLESAVADATQSKQSVVEVNKVATAVKSETNAAVSGTGSSVVANTTQAIAQKVEATAKQTQEALTSAQALSIEAGKTANEGQTLLSQDNLTQAVDKIKEVNAATNQVEKITDSAIKAVQTILPVASIVIVPTTSTSSSAPSVLVTSTINTTTGGPTTSIVSTKTSTTPSTTVK